MGEIITVVPAHEGAGGKFMATSIAYGIRQRYSNDPRIKIALVDFDFTNPYLGIDLILRSNASRTGIDGLLEKINSRSLTKELFLDSMTKIDGCFDILRGTRMSNSYDQYTRFHIETIINYLKSEYDYTVIAVSPNALSAGSIFGIMHADKVVMVCRSSIQSLLSFDKSLKMIKTYIGNENDKVNLIFNYRDPNNDIDFSSKIVPVKDEIKVVGHMKYYSFAVDNRNIKIGVMGKVDKFANEYKKQLEEIINNLLPKVTEEQ